MKPRTPRFPPTLSRRDWLGGAALLGGATALFGGSRADHLAAQASSAAPADPHAGHQHHPQTSSPASPGRPAAASPAPLGPRRQPEPLSVSQVREQRRRLGYTPVETPDGWTLPHRMRGGVKEFHLVAEPIRQEFASGMVVNAWGYNGCTPGPTLEAVEGDRVRIFLTNRLPEPTSIHWHGILLPNGMDGVSGLTQPAIPVGETWVYEFTLRQWGTYMYHPHADETVQLAMGMMGFFVIHPRDREAQPTVDRDFCVFPHMWFVDPGSATPDPSVMLDFNTFTFNGRAWPGTTPLVIGQGDRVRIRLGNVSMTSHPIHFHGAQAWVTQTDGGPIPRSAWWPETTINVAPGTTRAFEFQADLPGDWPMHCHKTHHAMNAMGHGVPNLIGADLSGVENRVSALVDGYMTMGTTGMTEHATHAGMMPSVENTLPMMTGEGPFGMIEMGGMFTILKVRAGLESYGDPGWYAHPDGTVAYPSAGHDLPEIAR